MTKVTVFFRRFLVSTVCYLFVVSDLTAKAECLGTRADGPTATPAPIVLSYSVGQLAADPIRPRVYATLPSENSVLVIDTDSLKVIDTIPIGSVPQGLALSADGSTLWVANSGSTTSAIGVLDLATLTRRPSLPAPDRPSDIEEGAGHRLYLTPASDVSDGIMQIDATTGAYQTSFGGFEIYAGSLLETSPDHNTLFFGNTGLSGSTLENFNVATSTPTLIRTVMLSGYGSGLRVAHNGQFMVYPNTEGNGMPRFTTFKIPTNDISSSLGSFDVGSFPGPATFSNDDTFLYQSVSNPNIIKVFDATTFGKVGAIPLPLDSAVSDMVVDRSGRWLFVARFDYFGSSDLRVFDTGRMDPVRPAQLGNISTRMRVLTNENALIGGFIISGTTPKRVIVRGIGPSLTQIIPDALVDPTLELYDGGTLLVSNDNWKSDQQAEIQATGLAPNNDLESAIVRTLNPGAYTAIMRGTSSNIGIGLVEVYDLDSSSESELGTQVPEDLSIPETM